MSDSEIANITGLNLSGMGISMIEGLQYLTSLQSLDCTNNNLTALDLSGNTALNAVSCDSQIRNFLIITSSGNASYPYQLDFTNYMTSAQIANVSNVQGLDNSGSNILTIYSNGVAMFVARPGSVTYSYNTGHNSQKMSVTLSAAVEINPNNFPDEVFGPYLFNFDTDGDGVLSPAEIEAVTEISINESGVKSLEGIWRFWNLRKLYYRSNSITGALTFSGAEYLEEINCRSNNITSIDVSGCTALKILNARSNQLVELNITDCDALEELNCQTREADSADHTNHITTLDLRGKSNLRELYCYRNGITKLDLTDCTALVSVDCSRNQLTSLNVSHITGLEYLVCGSNDLKSLDVTNNTALKHIDAWDCGLSEIDVSKNTELEYLELGGYVGGNNNSLTTIDISNNKKLTYLAVDLNQIANLDVTGLPLLEKLMFQHNKKITSIDLSHNPALKELYCHNCNLVSLDLSANTALTLLRCYSNDIKVLDLSNNPLISELSLGSSGIMSEIPALRLTYTADSNMPYRTDMKNYVGNNFTKITSVKGYTSAGGEISSSFMTDGTATFAQMPLKVVYTYDTGYTGSADISADMAVALVPDPDNFFSPLTVISTEPVISIERYPVPTPYPVSVVSTVISRETVVVVSREISTDIQYIRENNGGCNAVSGALMLSFLTGLTGFVFTFRKR